MREIIDHRLRGVIKVIENQFSFMTGRLTMKVIFYIRQFMKRYMKHKKDMHMVFIDLKKVIDKPKNIMWWALKKHKVSIKYITLFKDIHNNIVISV
jgi:hypothetical protein